MLDYLRNLTKSDEEKRQEALNAYLDDSLAPKQRLQVEKELAQDESLRTELDQMRLLQQQLRHLPQRRVRRNFTLDPALYGRPQREPLVQAYPVLRTATVLAAFFFIFALTANLFLNDSFGTMSSAEPVMNQMEGPGEMVAEAAVEEEAIEAEAADSIAMDTRIIEEAEEEAIVSEEGAVDSEITPSINVAEDGFGLLEMESNAAAPLIESAPLAEEAQAASPAEEKELAIMPTMTAEVIASSEQAVEQRALPTVVAAEPALQPSTRLAEAGPGEVDASASIRVVETQGDNRPFLDNSLSLIALLLGIVFAILIVLTLLARRRL